MHHFHIILTSQSVLLQVQLLPECHHQAQLINEHPTNLQMKGNYEKNVAKISTTDFTALNLVFQQTLDKAKEVS